MELFFQIIKVTIPISLGVMATLATLALCMFVLSAVIAWLEEHLF